MMFMSCISKDDEYGSVRASFSLPVPPVRRVERAEYDVAALRARLAPMAVPYEVSERRLAELSCGPVRLVVLCEAAAPHAEKMAHLAYQTARWYGDSTEPFTVVLACARAPKVLAHNRPLAMADINSGGTCTEERLIVLWRWDPDVYKVLIHELTHLCARVEDEARTEELALRLWCAWAARNRLHHEALREALATHLMALQRRVRACDVGRTNAARYWVEGTCRLMGGVGPACEPVGQQAHDDTEAPAEKFTVVPV